MKSEEEINVVLAGINQADPDFGDEELEAMRNAFRFVLGYEGTPGEFLAMYVESA